MAIWAWMPWLSPSQGRWLKLWPTHIRLDFSRTTVIMPTKPWRPHQLAGAFSEAEHSMATPEKYVLIQKPEGVLMAMDQGVGSSWSLLSGTLKQSHAGPYFNKPWTYKGRGEKFNCIAFQNSLLVENQIQRANIQCIIQLLSWCFSWSARTHVFNHGSRGLIN